jgi:hypothetical protein
VISSEAAAHDSRSGKREIPPVSGMRLCDISPVPEAPADKLQLLENDLPGSCAARMRLPSSKLNRLPDGVCGW